jgi:hypothetical protein
MRITIYKDWEFESGEKQKVEVIRLVSTGLPFILQDTPDKDTMLYYGKLYEVKHDNGIVSKVWKRYVYRKKEPRSFDVRYPEKSDFSYLLKRDSFLTIHGIEMY